MNFNTLKKNLKKDFTGMKTVKLALLGDSATQLLTMALRGAGYESGLNIDIYEADYDRIYETVINKDDRLYTGRYEYIIIFKSTQKLLGFFYSLSLEKKKTFAADQIIYLQNLAGIIAQNTSAKIIFYNFPEINDNVFGNFSSKTPYSFLHQLRKLNVGLQDISVENKNIFVVDVLSVSNEAGSLATGSSKWYITSQNVFALDHLAGIAKRTVDMLSAFTGRFKKCLIMDLDNTMWGGIIGDDGIENIEVGDLGIGKAFSALQYWAKALKERGILIAVCSKNDEHIAKEVFEKHPDMVLRLDDISIFVANWSNKADNIGYIQKVLNIGADSMVFIDDNPFERNLVKTIMPEVTIPDLPEDPAEYLPYLQSLNLFETVSFTEEDTVRTKLYKEESERVVLQQSFESVEDYLAGLEMEAKVEGLNKFNLARCAQLTQRSNQFNLTTIRFTEEQLQKFAEDGGNVIAISLRDKFGDYGMISMVLVKKNEAVLDVINWIMSCRVLKRGVEELVMNEIVKAAVDADCSEIRGRYLPTQKNGMVKDLFPSLGFEKINENESLLKCATFVPLKNHIKITV